MATALQANGVSAAKAHQIASLPPVGSLFAAFLGYNPMQKLLGSAHAAGVTHAQFAQITGKTFFPHLIADPFLTGLRIAFAASLVMCLIAAAASWMRGGQYVRRDDGGRAADGRPVAAPTEPATWRARRRVGAGVTDSDAEPGRCFRDRRSGTRRAGVTTRTLRYYQEVGLLQPSGATRGGNRLYTRATTSNGSAASSSSATSWASTSSASASSCGSEDRLAELRAEAQARHRRPPAGREMVTEAFELNHRMQAEINQKLGLLQGVLAELKASKRRYDDIVREHERERALTSTTLPRRVTHETDLDAALGGVHADWEHLGRADPLWAILTIPSARSGAWQLDQLFATGRAGRCGRATRARSCREPRARPRARATFRARGAPACAARS